MMNKEEFLKTLRKKISILKEEEINDIISEYSEFIDEKTKRNQSVEKTIKDLGNVNDLAKEILDAYKINDNYTKKNAGIEFFETCNNIIKKLVDKFSNKSFSEVIRFILEIIVIIIFIAILKIPFVLIEEIGQDIFVNLTYANIGNILNTIWGFLIEISYLVVAVLLFINIFKKRYLEDEKGNEEMNEEINKEKNNVKPEIKPNNIISNNNKEKAVFSFFKIIMLIMALPFIFSLVGLCAGFGFIIYVGIMYKWFVGLLLIALALIAGNIWLLDIFYRVIFDKPIKGLRVILSLVGVIILFIVGICICSLEFSKIETVPYPESSNKIKSITQTAELSPLYRTEINNHYNPDDATYIEYDKTLDNQIRIKAEYYDYLENVKISKTLEGEYDVNADIYATKYFFKSFFKDLKNNKIIDYSNVDNIKLTIYINEKDMNKLNLDDESYYLNGVYHPELDD